MKKTNRFTFTGYYGMSNFGDDLFGLVCVKGAEQLWPHSKTSVLSTKIDGIESVCTVPKGFNRDLYASSGIIGIGSRLGYALYEAMLSQMFILGGGSVLSSQSSGVRDFVYKTSKLTNLRFSAIGISIGPFTSQEEESRVKDFLSGFEYISVRDVASLRLAQNFLLDCPIVMAGDLAGLMPILYDTNHECVKHAKLTLGISLCNYESIVGGNVQVEQERNTALIDAVVSIAKRLDIRVEVFSLNNHQQFGDDKLAHSICSQLSDENIEYNLSRHIELGVFEIWTRIARCDAFISVRLHGAIAAYLNKVPFALVEYHQKCKDFLDDIGQSAELRLNASSIDSKKIEEVLEKLFQQTLQPAMNTHSYSERASEHFLRAPWRNTLESM